jgi:hypothetical protein
MKRVVSNFAPITPIMCAFSLTTLISQTTLNSPEEALEELGARVYKPSSEQDGLDWTCLAASEAIQKEVEDTILLPLKHPEIYEGEPQKFFILITQNCED